MKKDGRGRPRIMTDEKKAYVCEQIAAGRSVVSIVKDEGFNISHDTINLELKRDPFFMREYARAREYSIETKMEESEAILLGEGKWATVDFEIRKEIVNDRRWTAIRLARFRYGDKVDIDVNAKVQVEGRVIDAEAFDLDQLLVIKEALTLSLEGPKDEQEEDVIDAEYETGEQQ